MSEAQTPNVTTTASADVVSVMPSTPRRRPVVAEPAAAEGADAPKKSPRRRARASADAASPDTPPKDAVPSSDEPAPEKPKRRRGRPTKAETEARKAAEAAAAAASGAPSEAAASQPASEPASEKPKRRRGRPTKAEVEARKAAEAEAARASGEHAKQGEEGAHEGDAPSEQRAGSEEGRKRRQRPERTPRDRKGAKGQHDRQDRRDRAGHDGQRRQRRQHQGGGNREVRPSVTREELAALKVAELREKAAELELDVAGLKKAELVEAVFAASMQAEGFIEVEGILDTMPDGYGFLRTQGYLPSEHDAYVSAAMIRRNGLRKGDCLRGQLRPKRDNEKFAAVQTLLTVNGTPLEELGHRPRFADLTPVYPDERLLMEHGKSTVTARVIDLTAPIGKGQRGLIVSPPKAGKTTILKDIAAAITANNPEVHLMCLLVDERPEEVTDMQRSIKGEVISSTFDMPCENHIAVAEMVVERAKRLVECGEDVVILLDSITRLARAYNLAHPLRWRGLHGALSAEALPGSRAQYRARRQPHHPRIRAHRHGVEDGRGHLRGVQGHGQHGAAPRPQPGRPPHFPGHRPHPVGHAQRGPAARPAGGAAHLGGPPHPVEHEQHRARYGHAHQVDQADRDQPGIPAAHRQEGAGRPPWRRRLRAVGALLEFRSERANARFARTARPYNKGPRPHEGCGPFA